MLKRIVNFYFCSAYVYVNGIAKEVSGLNDDLTSRFMKIGN